MKNVIIIIFIIIIIIIITFIIQITDSYVLLPQELMAYGVTNTVCSMLNCYVSSASLSRSLVQEAAGGKTQVSMSVTYCNVSPVVFPGPFIRSPVNTAHVGGDQVDI